MVEEVLLPSANLQAIVSTVRRGFPFCKVRVVVPEAPDQVNVNGSPAVRPDNEGFVKARAAATLPIAKIFTRHN